MNKQLSYEQAFQRLQQIVAQIEAGETDIDLLAANLKEAKSLIDFCKNRLTKVESDVKKILGEWKTY